MGQMVDTTGMVGSVPRLLGAVSWVLVSLAMLQLTVFAVVAAHGFDLSDEGYYVLSMQHWRDTPAHSLFAAYFELPYRLIGRSLWRTRLFGFALLGASAVWLLVEFQMALDRLRKHTARVGTIAAAASGAAAMWDYYGGAFPVPLTPSYNLLALVCILSAIAVALRTQGAMSAAKGRAALLGALGFGIIASVALVNKFTAGVLTTLLALAVFCTLSGGKLRLRTGLVLAAAVIGGFALNLALLTVIDPHWPSRLSRGVAIQWAVLPRHPLGELAAFVKVDLPAGILRTLPALGLIAVLALPVAAALRRRQRRASATGMAMIAFTLGGLSSIYLLDTKPERILMAGIFALVLAGSVIVLKGLQAPGEKRAAMLAGLMLTAPFAYSFGTNNDLLMHMGMALVFPFAVAVASIREIWVERAIPAWGFGASLGLMAAFPMVVPYQMWTQPVPATGPLQERLRHMVTFRQLQPLARENVPMSSNPGGIDVRVDPRLAEALAGFVDLMRKSGFSAGSPIIDFTGQTPGLVALCGGLPVGSVWLVRGPVSQPDEAAGIAIDFEDADKVRRAWLLASPDSDGMRSWKSIVGKKVRGFPYEHAGDILLPDTILRSRPQGFIHVEVWRPKQP